MAKKKAPDGEATEAKPAAKKKPAPPKKKPAAAKKAKPAKKGASAEEPAAAIEAAEAREDARSAKAEAPVEEVVVEEPATPLTEEEQQLSEIYGEEMAAPAKAAHAEYQDKKTADEDRPMTPEINARDERRNQWQDRRDQRRRRRDERNSRRDGQGPGQAGGGQAGQQAQHNGHNGHAHQPAPQGGQRHEARPQEPRPPMQPPVVHAPIVGGEGEPLARVGTPLGDAAASVFAQLRNNQPLPVRQLAAMMRKRSLVNQDPEQLWPQLKAELLGDERSYRALGLRPRIVYRGRDLFAPGPVATSQTADAEAGVATALSRLAGATHRALSGRLARATAAGFERIIHAYLVAAGYREIEWVKRVGGISYATTLAPGLARTVLVSARSGDQPIDRRAIGELRVGVEAKDLVAGILFAPADVSEDAERELERAGRSIVVMCGEQLVAALVKAGVGVVSAAAPVQYLDDTLLDEILAG